MSRGKFISIEGIDGSGKSSIVEPLASYLRDQQLEVITTREPGGTQLAEEIREFLMKKQSEISPETESLLMFAARSDHLQKLILPSIMKGAWVISDRFSDSTFSYQCSAKGGSKSFVEGLAKLVHDGSWPDRTFWLRVSPEIARKRLEIRGVKNLFDSYGDSFQGRVHAGYQLLSKQYPERVYEIDASGSIDSVLAAILPTLDPWLNTDKPL